MKTTLKPNFVMFHSLKYRTKQEQTNFEKIASIHPIISWPKGLAY